MSVFRDFERKVVRMLVRDSLTQTQIDSLLDTADAVSYEHTGVGYFLTVRHSAIKAERTVCNRPLIMGKADDIECGFIVFLEGGTLTLECHSWGDDVFPEDFRERKVEIVTQPEFGR